MIFATPGSVIFGVKEIRESLKDVVRRYGIHFKPFYAPVKIDAENQIVTFKGVGTGENKCVLNEDNALREVMSGESIIEMPFDMLHIAPPQTAPKFIKESGLVDASG